MVRAKYVTEFTIKKGKISSSRVIGEEYATPAQTAAIASAKPLLRKFVSSRLGNDIRHQDCTVSVKVGYVETNHGLQLTFKV